MSYAELEIAAHLETIRNFKQRVTESINAQPVSNPAMPPSFRLPRRHSGESRNPNEWYNK